MRGGWRCVKKERCGETTSMQHRPAHGVTRPMLDRGGSESSIGLLVPRCHAVPTSSRNSIALLGSPLLVDHQLYKVPIWHSSQRKVDPE